MLPCRHMVWGVSVLSPSASLKRRCSRCEAEKPEKAFSRLGPGRQRWCKECFREWKKENPERVEQHKKNRVEGGYWRRYGQSRKGIINALVNSLGYPREDAEVLSDVLIDPETSCAICGIPNKILRTLVRQNFVFPLGTTSQNRRLTPDNLEPGKPHVLARTRILCRGCNSRRGADLLDDATVLQWARREWTQRLPARLLSWLRVKPLTHEEAAI